MYGAVTLSVLPGAARPAAPGPAGNRRPERPGRGVPAAGVLKVCGCAVAAGLPVESKAHSPGVLRIEAQSAPAHQEPVANAGFGSAGVTAAA